MTSGSRTRPRASGSAENDSPSTIALESAVWLGERVVVLVCSVAAGGKESFELVARAGRRVLPLETSSLVYRHSGDGGGHRAEALLVGCLDEEATHRTADVKLSIQHGTATRALPQAELAAAATDVRTLARSRLAILDPETREALLALLAYGCAGALRGEGRISLARRLFQLREALRERLPCCVVSREEPQGMHVDSILAVDERSFWVKGWVRDGDAATTALRLVSPEGARVAAVPGEFRFARPDVEAFYAGLAEPGERSGFISFVDLPAPNILDSGWVAELENTLGTGVEVTLPTAIRDSTTVRDSILSDLTLDRIIGGDLTVEQAFPALSRLQERLSREVAIDTVVQHGSAPAQPRATVVVPLYGRIDFLEHQLAHFVHDPELRETDLVYVLDSPELGDHLTELASQMHALYRVPFRVVSLTRNGGFSLANNLGASVARGKRLVFLNSDVLPDRPGWLSRMLDFYDRTPRIGALGAKLLYEDGSLQHAGMYYEQTAGSDLWENAHFFKGLHRDLPAANVARPVPAVTAACLMIDRALFEELGGLRGMYIQGDYEDSDLCLRLLESGRENWYLPEAELFHLEGQSYPSELRKLTRRYNTWLQTHLWNGGLEVASTIGSTLSGSGVLS